MIFERDHLYHIYNQGNNKQKIFFSRDNYLFFLNKIKKHVLPHADIIAWCLMPNHFHLMVYVHSVEVDVDSDLTHGVTDFTHGVTQRHPVSDAKKISLNNNIAIMLRSYTRAINKQFNRSGALFRESTKSECLTSFDGITPSFFNTAFGTQINVRIPEKEYPQACFSYIHQNPVKAKLVEKAEDWEFSSYQDYSGKRNGKLVNKERAKEYVDISLVNTHGVNSKSPRELK